MKKYRKFKIILITILLLISILIAILVNKNDILRIDKIAYSIIVEKLRTPSLTKFMKLITKLSNPIFIITLYLILSIIIFLKNKKLGIIFPLNLVIVTLLNQTLKYIVRRQRPSGYRLIDISGYSFPSGHAMISLATYGLLLYIVSKIIKTKPIKIIISALLITIILLIGISRIYLGVHYLSDVLVGYILSTIYLLTITELIDIEELKKSQNIP